MIFIGVCVCVHRLSTKPDVASVEPLYDDGDKKGEHLTKISLQLTLTCPLPPPPPLTPSHPHRLLQASPPHSAVYPSQQIQLHHHRGRTRCLSWFNVHNLIIILNTCTEQWKQTIRSANKLLSTFTTKHPPLPSPLSPPPPLQSQV